MIICDFCGGVTVMGKAKLYEIEPFSVIIVGQKINYDKDWAACHLCQRFIDEKNKGALVNRVKMVHMIDEDSPTGMFLVALYDVLFNSLIIEEKEEKE